MNLVEHMMTPCIIMNKIRSPDGEGGTFVQWQEGAEIMAAIVRDTTMDARVAEQQGVSSVFTITTSRGVRLEYHDVIKRKSDGKIFRVTSDYGDKESPAVGSLDIAQVTAEKWELST